MAQWRPDYLSLRLFVAVCEEASITRAAERESLVPSAVSKRISELEDATGVALLVRGNRGVQPTQAGIAFLHHARQILLSTSKLQGEMADYARGTRGHVRISANLSSIAQFLPRDIASFLALHPDIRVDLEEKVSTDVVNAVREGQCDIGVCLSIVNAEGLERQPYEADRLVVLAHPGHPVAGLASTSFLDTLDYEFISTQANAATTTFLSSLAARHGHTLRYRMHVSTLEALCHIVAENLGIAIVAEGAVRTLAAGLRLHTTTLLDSWAQRDIVLYVRNHKALPTPALLLFEHLGRNGAARGNRRPGRPTIK